MKVEMLMPQMGESITEATVLKWLKNVGDKVNKDETILEISTDKVDSEIPAPETGLLAEIKAMEGETVQVKSIIAIIETDLNASIDDDASSKAAPAEDKSPKEEPKKESLGAGPAQPSIVKSPPPAAPQPAAIQQAPSSSAGAGMNLSQASRYYSPLVLSLAKQNGVSASELNSIQGSGNQNRVTKQDFFSFLESRGQSTSNEGSAKSASAPKAKAAAISSAPSAAAQQDGVTVEPMTKMRQLIAEHMVRSKATSPHVYSVAEVDVTNIAIARKKHQAAFVKREGFKLSFTPFFLLAAVKGLIQYPQVNSSVDGNNILIKKDVNLGVAVALGNTGLIVPVIKKADQLSLGGIARQLKDLAERARSKKLKPDETQGGTFTVTNPGIFGNIIGCPIINQPQAAILATCAIKKRPVVVNDMIAIRSMMNITLSYDHRIIDGSTSGMFLKYVTDYIESWDPEDEIL